MTPDNCGIAVTRKKMEFLGDENVILPVCVLMCRFSREGLSKALVQTPQGRSALSLGRALGVGPLDSGRSPCELAAELSPDNDLPSSSADGGEFDSALESSDIDRSSGESVKEEKRVNII